MTPALGTQFCPLLTTSLFATHPLALFTRSVHVFFPLYPSLPYHFLGDMAICKNADPSTGLCFPPLVLISGYARTEGDNLELLPPQVFIPLTDSPLDNLGLS